MSEAGDIKEFLQWLKDNPTAGLWAMWQAASTIQRGKEGRQNG